MTNIVCQIDHVAADHVADVAAIYNAYVINDIATFEELPVTIEEMSRRIDEVRGRSLPWLVAREVGKVVGYAYAGSWKARSAYRHTVESSVYVAADGRGRGIGTQLYSALIGKLRSRELHAVIGGVSLPNVQSVRLHESLGFQKIGEFKEVGFKFGRWIDVGYWQLLL